MTLLGILIVLSLHRTYAALNVIAPSPQKTFVANDATLICTFSVNKKTFELNFLAVVWSFQGEVIMQYDNKGLSSKAPRMSLDVNALENGNASLHISNVAISDRGIYKCAIIYSPEVKEMEISFEVLARPLLSILSTEVYRNKENSLICMATGFFPPDIGITWYRDEQVLTNPFMGKPEKNKDGTYQVNSSVTIMPTGDDQNQTFSCRVQHDSLEKPLQRDFKLDYKDEETSSISTIIPIMLVVIIIIISIVVFFLWKRKNGKKASDKIPFIVKEIEGPAKVKAGEETFLHCEATKSPENTTVTWLKKKDGRVQEIPQSRRGDMEEEERLMDMEYVITQYKEGPNYTTSLKFTPSVTEHKDMTFICRYKAGKETKEKSYHCRAIYAKPQLQPISHSLFPGELKYLVTLEKFYPKDITIRWTHGLEEPQHTVSSTETFLDNSDGTYRVYSEVRIPEELLKDPKFTVRVTWEHESLDSPGYKDLSIRDLEYPWNPVVEEIQTPQLFHDTPVTLQCRISEYFPNDITVTWWRRSENQELCEETENKISSEVTAKRENDNTYSGTASLTIIPKLSVHQGAEYICRVDHPSLESPIERRTGELTVKAKPQMVEPILITIGDFSRVNYTLNLLKFYPENMTIEWRSQYQSIDSIIPPKTTITKHTDLTYGVTSVGSISIHSLKDVQCKVSVTWKHESMDGPETRTLTRRDLPWRPQVAEITIPNLEKKKKAALTCEVSGYFPDDLTVTWFRKDSGTDSQPAMVHLSKDNYQVTKKELKDKTFSCQSSLTFTPSSRDQGTEFICRVEHPSLEHPIEKTTGPIRIELSRPEVGEISVPRLVKDKKASLMCEISGCSSDQLTMTWFKKEPGTELNPTMTPLPKQDYQVSDNTKKGVMGKTISYQSSVTFIPSYSRDQGAEFICRVEHPSLEHPIEKTTGPIELSCPQVGEISVPRLVEGKEVSMTCTISGCSLDHLKVNWSKMELRTNPTVTSLPNQDYKVDNKKNKGQMDETIYQSFLMFKPSYIRDLGAEFKCRVEHPSLEHPIEKTTGPIRIELSRPQVGEISVPRLVEGKEVSMTCDISECTLDYLTVTWLKKEPGTDPDPTMTPLHNQDFQVANKKKTKGRRDKTVFYQSSVTFIPSSRDQGAEFICRVEHPSLEHHIEKTTGPLVLEKLGRNGSVKISSAESMSHAGM